MPRGDEVTATEMEALLAELATAGGTLDGNASAKPYTQTQARGSAGSTNILREQHQPLTRGAGLGPTGPRRISGGTASSVSNATAGGAATPTTASSGGSAAIGFSSYKPLGMTEGELRSERHTATKLGVRLAPLGPAVLSPTTPQKVSPNTAPLTPRPPRGPGRHASVAGAGGAVGGRGLGASLTPTSTKRNSKNGGDALPSPPLALGMAALPALPNSGGGGQSSASAGTAADPPPAHAFSFRYNYRESLAEEDERQQQQQRQLTDSGAAGASSGPSSPAKGTAAISGAATSEEQRVYREANFLPIMCARYLNPAGLTPPARWGHTLTAIGGSSSASRLFMFGGIELSGSETNTLALFDTSAIAWEPAPAGPGDTPPPAPRYGHAACAFEDRHLIICGGAASNGGKLFGDIHLYDTQTNQWRCLWTGNEFARGNNNKNEPAPRFGHTLAVYDDRLYVFGGRVQRSSSPSSVSQPSSATPATTTVANGDVYVFSLNSRRWKRRIRAPATVSGAAAGTGRRGSGITSAAAASEKAVESSNKDDADNAASVTARDSPCGRAFHAAAMIGSLLYINGGVGSRGNALGDTWELDVAGTRGTETAAGGRGLVWWCLHRGESADAIPRERHDLFACGEALLVVGGCNPSAFGGGVADKFTHFVAVLPTVGPRAGACWIPVAMGNVAIVAPSKRSFAAAFTGGFVYVFGGTTGTALATSTMIRFLAADGYVAADARATSVANDEAIRGLMRQLRERPPVPFDIVAVASVTSRDAAVASGGSGGTYEGDVGLFSSTVPSRETRFHRMILQQRAPALLDALQACRAESATVALSAGAFSSSAAAARRGSATTAKAHRGVSGKSNSNTPDNGTAGALTDHEGDVVDALLQQRHTGYGGQQQQQNQSSNATAAAGLVVTYDTAGNNRVQGLPHPLTAEELSCLADYVYWGGLPALFKRLLRDEGGSTGCGDGGRRDTQPHNAANGDDADAETAEAQRRDAALREHLRATLEALRTAAADFHLPPLAALVNALLTGNREALAAAQAASGAALRADMAAMLDSSVGATCTVLFADPHTKQQTAHPLHPAMLMAASNFFLELLRPLFLGERATFQVGAVAAKVAATGSSGGNSKGSNTNQAASGSASDTPTATASRALLFSGASTLSKRTLLIGPVAVPTLAVPWILRYLYTQQLHAPREAALEVMLGAHQLGLPLLQAYAEALVARESVNYESCCAYYFLAKKHGAALLEETSLLTAVSGYAEVRLNPAYRDLSEEDRRSIDAVAKELGAASWVPPPQPTNEMKSSEAYAARWKAASA